MKTIEVSKLQAIIEASTKEAKINKSVGTLELHQYGSGIESVVKALEELIEAEK